MDEIKISNIEISITHEEDYAIAMPLDIIILTSLS